MKHDIRLRQGAVANQFAKLGLVQIVCNFAVGEIAELLRPREVVDRDDVPLADGRSEP